MQLINRLKQIFATFSIVLLVLACGSDDAEGPVDNTTQLEQERAATALILSGGIDKTWRITEATLSNDTGSFDISNNFNVVDDEFTFSSTGTLVWKPGNDINYTATNPESTLLDYYRSPQIATYQFNTESGTELTSLNGSFSFTVVDQSTITGSLNSTGRNNANGTITLTLAPKLAGDYVSAPENGLNFTEINTFNSVMVNSGSIGITGSYADNSILIITREDSEPNANAEVPEKIIKLALDNNTFESNFFYQTDFVTKRPHIINNELIVAGARYVNIYDLNLGQDPVSNMHNANNGDGLTRFGSAVRDDEIYITGGDLNPSGTDDTGDKIRRYNNITGALETIATLPESRYWAGTEIVNDELFIFGGHKTFVEDQNPESTSFIYNLNSGEMETFQLPLPLAVSYAVRVENLIYLGGQIHLDLDGDTYPDDYNIYLGVYNTQDGSLTAIDHNLDATDQFTTIFGMTIFNGKIYAVYGDAAQPIDWQNGNIPIWSIMAADLI